MAARVAHLGPAVMYRISDSLRLYDTARLKPGVCRTLLSAYAMINAEAQHTLLEGLT